MKSLHCKGVRWNGTTLPRSGAGASRRALRVSAAAEAGSRPSRGVVILPGLGNNAADYGPLADIMRSKGLAVETVQISRLDWSRNAAALTDPNWWKGTLKPRPAVDWYLTQLEAAVDRLKREVDGAPITLLSHSAGGWLGRVYMLDFGTTGIDRYVTLGSPHAPPPAGAEGVVDQTRGILTFCSDATPGAYHPEVQYVTIAGKFIKGASLGSNKGLLAKFAGAGYQQVCGDPEAWGDFIVPTSSAHLAGALQVDLEGVFHSPLGAKLSFLGPWYGSEGVVEQWLHHVAGGGEELARTGAGMAAEARSAA